MEQKTITQKIFLDDVYKKEHSSVIKDVFFEDGYPVLILGSTIFFPGGGGQSCDLGEIENVPLRDVFEKDNEIFHVLEKTETPFSRGQSILCRLDWARRFDNMQRHCGEHILSGVFSREYGGVNRGFHMGSDYMTIDISLEEKDNGKESDDEIKDPNSSMKTDGINWEIAMRAQDLANEIIWQNKDISIHLFADPENANSLPLRKPADFDEDVSVVLIGEKDDPSDCVACCGTHPHSSSEVGLIKIYKVEKYKGMFRIYFDAGARAMADYNKKHNIVNDLCIRHSAGTEDLMEKISASDTRVRLIRDELNTLRHSVITSRIEETGNILDRLAKGEDPLCKGPFSLKGDILVCRWNDMKTDDLLNIGRPLSEKIKKLLIIVSKKDNTLLFFSDGNVDCSKLVRENAGIYNGKGGGNATSSRAIFPKEDDIDLFIDLAEKHLR